MCNAYSGPRRRSRRRGGGAAAATGRRPVPAPRRRRGAGGVGSRVIQLTRRFSRRRASAPPGRGNPRAASHRGRSRVQRAVERRHDLAPREQPARDGWGRVVSVRRRRRGAGSRSAAAPRPVTSRPPPRRARRSRLRTRSRRPRPRSPRAARSSYHLASSAPVRRWPPPDDDPRRGRCRRRPASWCSRARRSPRERSLDHFALRGRGPRGGGTRCRQHARRSAACAASGGDARSPRPARRGTPPSLERAPACPAPLGQPHRTARASARDATKSIPAPAGRRAQLIHDGVAGVVVRGRRDRQAALVDARPPSAQMRVATSSVGAIIRRGFGGAGARWMATVVGHSAVS